MPDNQANFSGEQNNKQDKPGQNGNPTNTSLSDADVLELLPGFVLGALEPDEMLAVEAYVHQHPALLSRLTELEAATDQMAYAAPYAPLPSQAKVHLMQRVQADLVAHPVRRNANPLLFPPQRRIAPKPSAVTNPMVVQRAPARNWFGLLARTLIGATVAAALILLLMSTVQLRNTAIRLAAQLTAVKNELAQLQTQNSQLKNVNQSLQEQLQNRATQIALLINPKRTIELAGTDKDPNATGTFYIDNDTGVLVLHGLQPLPDNQAYQLWFIPAKGAPVPSGVIQFTNAAANTLTVRIPAEGQNFAKLGVTIEPASGSPAPTGALVLLGSPT